MTTTATTIFETTDSKSFSTSLKSKSTYQPQLDGLRALAILSVLIEHFGLTPPDLLRFGPLSVRFFFVLSGYFITVSLWKIQTRMHDSEESSLAHLLRFYFSRFLRIGPPFYLALALGALFGIVEIRTNFFWLATFQTNIYIAHLGYWPASISHFWSLAVQEQFYLLWPLAVLTLPRRWFLPAITAFIVFGLGFRIFCIMTSASTITRWVLLFGCIDSFAVGALVAYLRQSRLLEKMWQSKTLLFAMPLAAFGCFFMGRALMTLPEGNVWLALTESFDAIFLAWLLASALNGMTSRYAQFLTWSPLVYLGKISYGIYVYHVFVIIIMSPLLVHLGMSANHDALGRLLILFALTITLASLSWHYLEKPFLAWKDELALGAKPNPLAEPQPAFA